MAQNRTVPDLVFTILIHVLFGVLIWLTADFQVLGDLGVVPGVGPDGQPLTLELFRDGFLSWGLVTVGISLLAALAWYVLGEWGMKTHQTSSGTWILIWLVLLALVLCGAFAATWFGPSASENGYILASFYFLTGFLAYYICTAVLSPVNIKYVVPGSKLIRS